jgi:hypothetical protein
MVRKINDCPIEDEPAQPFRAVVQSQSKPSTPKKPFQMKNVEMFPIQMRDVKMKSVIIHPVKMFGVEIL